MRIQSSVFLVPIAFSLVLATSLASAQDLPARKSGQWEIKMLPDAGGMPAMTMQACVDEGSDKAMMRAGLSMSESMCSRQKMKQEGDTFVIDSTCQVGSTTTESHVVISGDFQSAYSVKITSQSTGPMAAMAGAGNMTQEARWIGPQCADGLSPGDMLMPGGMKINVNEMMNSLGGG